VHLKDILKAHKLKPRQDSKHVASQIDKSKLKHYNRATSKSFGQLQLHWIESKSVNKYFPYERSLASYTI
jgi:hypothetical protein